MIYQILNSVGGHWKTLPNNYRTIKYRLFGRVQQLNSSERSVEFYAREQAERVSVCERETENNSGYAGYVCVKKGTILTTVTG
jgi:hypothetical protein